MQSSGCCAGQIGRTCRTAPLIVGVSSNLLASESPMAPNHPSTASLLAADVLLKAGGCTRSGLVTTCNRYPRRSHRCGSACGVVITFGARLGSMRSGRARQHACRLVLRTQDCPATIRRAWRRRDVDVDQACGSLGVGCALTSLQTLYLRHARRNTKGRRAAGT